MNRISHCLLACCLVLGFPAGSAGWAQETLVASRLEPGEAAQLEQACRNQLERVGAALDAYREDRGELPMWLSDLLEGGYLDADSDLVCPVTRKTGEVPHLALYFEDPQVEDSYLYEYSPSPVGPGARPGEFLTMRAWKERCETVVGDIVPMVRCVLHDRVLNVSVGGKIYESDLNWEDAVPNPEDIPRLGLYWREDGKVPGPEEWKLRDEAWVGTPAVPFRLESPQGGTVDLQAWLGERVIVLEFWSTWCRPCHRSLPHLDAMVHEYAGEPVAFLAVNWKEKAGVVTPFLERRELTLPVALDRTGTVALDYGVRGVPRTVVIGTDGRIRAVHSGFGPESARVLREEIDRALAAAR